MERKIIELVVGLVLIAAATMFGTGSVMAHIPPGSCIQHCLSECKVSGLDASACIRYCPVHCLPHDTSTKEHYCNLGCMLDQCSKYSDDENKMTSCMFNCRKNHCNIEG